MTIADKTLRGSRPIADFKDAKFTFQQDQRFTDRLCDRAIGLLTAALYRAMDRYLLVCVRSIAAYENN